MFNHTFQYTSLILILDTHMDAMTWKLSNICYFKHSPSLGCHVCDYGHVFRIFLALSLQKDNISFQNGFPFLAKIDYISLAPAQLHLQFKLSLPTYLSLGQKPSQRHNVETLTSYFAMIYFCLNHRYFHQEN